MRHRPIALGVQGLADTYMMLRLPFECEKAQILNKQIFETIYHATLEASCELAQKEGKYSTFEGSPASKGILQFDMWNAKPFGMWDWDTLKKDIVKHGLRNSLTMAPMPTASTSQILGYNECFEPVTSNMYSRRVLSGEFQVVNPYLLRDLVDLGIWDDSMKQYLITQNGSIKDLPNVPQDLKDLYKTVWEISQKTIINMAADRSIYIDQSHSLNLFLQSPSMGKITSMHFYGWKKGLKTGMYYLRTQAASAAIQFTIDQDVADQAATHVASTAELNRPVYIPTGTKFSDKEAATAAAETLDNDKEASPVPSEPSSVSSGMSNMKLEDGARVAVPTENIKEDSGDKKCDIYNEKVIACSAPTPEACESCSG